MKQTILFLSLVGLGAFTSAESIPEPGTVFYGKVLVPSGGGQYQLHHGELSWLIATPQGTELKFETSLEAIGGGALSYRLTVPHYAASSGASVAEPGVPLETGPRSASHLQIKVNGQSARINGPQTGSFELAQALRGSTHRLDLVVGIDLPDSDQDGLHDWWELEHGLDPYDETDAELDGDGDGALNLAEFLNGTDPTVDDRRAQIVTRELAVYPGVRTGFLVDVLDQDTPLQELQFRLESAPVGIDLFLAGKDEALESGARFLGEDLRAGRLTIGSPTDQFTTAEVRLSVSDEAQADPAVSTIILRRAEVAEEDSRAEALHLAGSEDRVVWDGRGLTRAIDLDLTGSEKSSVVLLGATGGSVSLSAQNDRAVFFDSEPRLPFSVSGFRSSGHDQLDLRPALGEVSGDLRTVVHLEAMETLVGSALKVMIPGNETPLRGLWEGRHLLIDGVSLPSLVGIRAVQDASENGPRAGEFLVERSGDASEGLEVGIRIVGSATNGVDYGTLDERVVFQEGELSVRVLVTPNPDSLTEQDEVVELILNQGAHYELGNASARLSIRDLMPEVAIEALEPVASVAEGASGTFLVTRSGLMDRSVLVRLRISGTASPGGAYEPISAFVNFLPFQSTALISVKPKEGAAIEEGGESVNLSLLGDPSYLLGDQTGASVIIVPERKTFDALLAGNPTLELADLAFAGLRSRPHVTRSNGSLHIQFLRPRSITGLTWTVEYSEDLVNWERGENVVEEITPLWEDGNVNRALYRAIKPATEAPQQFLRVVVQKGVR